MKKHLSKKLFITLFCIILVIAFLMRFYALGLKPMHHDEGNNWYHYIDKISHGQGFEWSVFNHGTFSFYMNAFPLFFLEPSIFNFRIMAALFGFLLIPVLLLLRKQLGDIGTLTAAAFIAVSPSLVYYSRMAGTYPYMLVFVIIALFASIKYFETFNNWWLYLLAVCASLMVLSHELVLVYFAVTASFFFLAYLFSEHYGNEIKMFWQKMDKKALLIAIAIFLFLILLFISQFFSRMDNIVKFADVSYYSSRTYQEVGHNKPVFYYFKSLAPIEVFAFLGTLISIFFLKRQLFQQFLFYWAISSVVFLSILPYKIPWMFCIALLPMYLLAGITAANIFEAIESWEHRTKRIMRVLFLASLFALLATSVYASVRLNYMNPNGRDSANVLNYAGAVDDNYRMISDFEKKLNAGRLANESVLMSVKDQYPLNYYLRSHYIEYLEADVVDLSQYYGQYGIFVISRANPYDSTLFTEIGEYELRENEFIRVLMRAK